MPIIGKKRLDYLKYIYSLFHEKKRRKNLKSQMAIIER